MQTQDEWLKEEVYRIRDQATTLGEYLVELSKLMRSIGKTEDE